MLVFTRLREISCMNNWWILGWLGNEDLGPKTQNRTPLKITYKISRNGCIDLSCVSSVQTSPNVENKGRPPHSVLLEVVSSRFQVILRWGLRSLHLGEFCRKRRPWSNLFIIENLFVSYKTLRLEAVSSRIEPFSSDFEGVLRFPFFGGGSGEGVIKKRIPWSNLLIIEDRVVFYKSQVDIAFSSYL